jgi:hypothetical protein
MFISIRATRSKPLVGYVQAPGKRSGTSPQWSIAMAIGPGQWLISEVGPGSTSVEIAGTERRYLQLLKAIGNDSFFEPFKQTVVFSSRRNPQAGLQNLPCSARQVRPVGGNPLSKPVRIRPPWPLLLYASQDNS